MLKFTRGFSRMESGLWHSEDFHYTLVGSACGGFSVCRDEVTYNPYRFDSFVRKADHKPVKSSDFALMLGRQVWVGDKD